MARGDAWIHRWAHTYAGAGVVALAAIAAGKPACEALLRWWHSRSDVPLKEYFNPNPQITWPAAFIGAVLGAFSHVLFDSIVHADSRPLLPFGEANPSYGLVSEGMAYALCFAGAVLGTLLCATIVRDKL